MKFLIQLCFLVLTTILFAAETLSTDQQKILRSEAISSAKVWQEPKIPIPQANLRESIDDKGNVIQIQNIECRWDISEPPSGMSPKFKCLDAAGEKYMGYVESNVQSAQTYS